MADVPAGVVHHPLKILFTIQRIWLRQILAENIYLMIDEIELSYRMIVITEEFR